MSNDLISRSALLEEINNFSMRITGSANAMAIAIMEETKKSIAKLIDEQSTAYNVDKVVEQLEKESQNIELIYPTDQGYDYEDAIGIDINKAKQIVKSGGIE